MKILKYMLFTLLGLFILFVGVVFIKTYLPLYEIQMDKLYSEIRKADKIVVKNLSRNNTLTSIFKEHNSEYKLKKNDEKVNPKENLLHKIEESKQRLNIKYMHNGYCYGVDAPYPDPKEAEGLTTNLPIDFPPYYTPSTKTLELRAFPTEKSIFKKSYVGFKLLLANSTDKNITIAHEDSRFNIIAQAKETNGTWRDIEHCPHSTCGNSYGTYQLPPYKAWLFSAPIYGGNTKVKLRYKMGDVVSNEFDGMINKEQFAIKWRDPNDQFDWLYGDSSF